MEWTKVETTGTGPSARYGHSFTLVGDLGYVFGGACGGVEPDSEPTFLKDMFVLNTASNPPSWKPVAQKGAIPLAREGHSCTAVGKLLYLFGGTGVGDVCLNDFYVFDIATETWSPVAAKGSAPSKRNNHSACAVLSRIFIFGGFLDGVAGNDVHVFDTKTQTWSQIKPTGKSPVERCDHTWVPVGNKLVLFGGAGDSVWYNDVHIFHTETGAWLTPIAQGTPPKSRDYHSCVVLDDKSILIFGGANDSDSASQYNDVHVFDITTSTWLQPKIGGQVPPVRWGHAAGMVGNVMWTTGGTSGSKYYNDVWKLAPSSNTPSTSGDLPTKPPRGTATKTASTASVTAEQVASMAPKKENALEPLLPIPNKRINYSTPTAVPAQRIAVKPQAAGEVAQRDLSSLKNKVLEVVNAMFTDIQGEYLKLDTERAIFEEQKKAFEEEKKSNQQLFEKQQREVTEMIEQHRQENAELMRKRQVQYDEKLEEIRQRQETLKQREETFKKTLDEFDQNKKKMEAVMAQFATFKNL
jgi:N-acetylneuraminic acid mutarotase